MITTAHVHESGVIFHFLKSFQTKKKIKAVRPKMTKIASRGSCLNPKLYPQNSHFLCSSSFFVSVLFHPLPVSVNLPFLLVHCLYNNAETTGRLSAGSPTTSLLQNSPSCDDLSLDRVKKKKKKKRKKPNEGSGTLSFA